MTPSVALQIRHDMINLETVTKWMKVDDDDACEEMECGVATSFCA